MSAYLEGHIRNNSDRYHSNRSLKSIDDVIENYRTKLLTSLNLMVEKEVL